MREKHAEKRRLERLQAALPLVTRQQILEEELAQLGDVVLLSEMFQKTRLEAQLRRDTAQVAQEIARASITRLDRQLADLVVPEALLAKTDAIERLQEVLAAARKARRALPRKKPVTPSSD